MSKMTRIKKYVLAFLTVGLVFMPLVVSADASKTFSDVPKNHAHYETIMELTSQGAIGGYNDGTYRPGQAIGRQHVAVILYRVLALEAPSDVGNELSRFSDVDESHEYANQIAAVTKLGIFGGYSDGTFRPNAKITRQQMATVLVNGFDLEDYMNKYSAEKVGMNLVNVDDSHKKSVLTLANLYLTVALQDFKPGNELTRGQFATFVVRVQELLENGITEREEYLPPAPKPKQETKPKEEKSNIGNPMSSWDKEKPNFNFPPLKTPSALPGGATLISKISPAYHKYTYSRSLPGGGSITEVTASSEYEDSIIMSGTDNNGESYNYKYIVSREVIQSTFFLPKFTEDDISILYEVGRAFAKAYGM